jgi:hypothetical protein
MVAPSAKMSCVLSGGAGFFQIALMPAAEELTL